jgi:hypothetical protein
MNAFALNALAFNSTRLVVPVVGGLMMVWVGPGPTILWGAALYFISSLTVMGMTITRRESDEERPARGIARLVEAARFVFSEPIAVLVVGLAALQLVIVMPFVHGLLPVYAADVFDMGPAGLGMLMSALGAGAAIGTITLASFGEVARKGRLLVVVMSGNLIAMVALAQSGGVLHPALAMFALGGATAAQFSIGGAIVLGMTPESLRGRVSALSMMVLGLFPAGALVAGGLAEAFSAPTATLIGAGAIVVVLAALRGPLVGLWRLSDTDA